MNSRLTREFFAGDVLDVAPLLLGSFLVRDFGGGEVLRVPITEVEAYRGAEDLACHASKGRTPRTEVMFGEGGVVYVYLIYGMYWMLNFVTGVSGSPQAALIRGVEGCCGPGRVGRLLRLDRSFYGEDLALSDRIWIEQGACSGRVVVAPRIGVDYAGEYWAGRLWRFFVDK